MLSRKPLLFIFSFKRCYKKQGKHNTFCLPADSPVLIQSGFAMLAIAKISAARKRHPEMIVSLSIPLPAAKPRGKTWKSGGRYPSATTGC